MMIEKIEKIRRAYNDENDVIADNIIPWYVLDLAELIEQQEKEIRKLRNRLKILEDEIGFYHGRD